MERKKARLAPLDECLKLCELLPRLAFRGDVAQLEVVLSWAQRQKGHCAVVEALASTDGAGRTPLVSAVRGQQLAAAAAILRRGADPSQPMIDQRRDTPLHVACRRNHGAMVELLLECGANAHAINTDGQSPLDLVVVGAACGSAAFRRARHALRERACLSTTQGEPMANCCAGANDCDTVVNLDAAGKVLGITDAQALQLIQGQLDAAICAAPSFPLQSACELPPQLREVALQYAHRAACSSICTDGIVADTIATEASTGGPNGWDWDHCTLQRIQSTYSTREHSLVWLDDKFEQVAQATHLVRQTSVVSSPMQLDTATDDAPIHLPLLLSCSRADVLAVRRHKGSPARAEDQDKDLDHDHAQGKGQEEDQERNCQDDTELLEKLVQFVESDTPVAIKPRHGANGHGIATFSSPRSAGLDAMIGACHAAAEVDNARLGENWQLARVPRGVLVQPLYTGFDRDSTAPLELKVQTIFGVVIGATLHTHPWQFWVFGGNGEQEGGGGGALHAWCDHGAANHGRGAKGAPRKWKKTHGIELPVRAVETPLRVLQTDWHHIAALSARLARNAGLDELRVDWLVGDEKWGSRVGELTYIGGAERLVPALSKPFGHAFLVAHGSRLSAAAR